jgi:hypothetical protein
MSGAKRTRASRRKRLPVQSPAQDRELKGRLGEERSRRELAVRRARKAKLGITAAAAVSAAVAMGLARVTYGGHQKHVTPPLAVPQPLYAVVRHNLLQAGILAPATAPPTIATSSS